MNRLSMEFINRLQYGTEQWLQRFGIAALQVALGATSFWLGWLKFAERSPITPVLHVSFPEYEVNTVLQVAGVVEMLVGLGLLLPLLPLSRSFENLCIRLTLVLLTLELVVIFGIILFSPAAIFYPYLPFLTVVGEYLARHVVFVATAIVIMGHVRQQKDYGTGT